MKIGDPIKLRGNNSGSAVVVAIGKAVIIGRKPNGQTVTQPRPGYEIPQYS